MCPSNCSAVAPCALRRGGNQAVRACMLRVKPAARSRGYSHFKSVLAEGRLGVVAQEPSLKEGAAKADAESSAAVIRHWEQPREAVCN